MATKLEVWNLALTYLDISDTIQDANEASMAAGVAKRYYDFARKKVLERCYWDFASTSAPLALLLDQNTLPQANVLYPGYRFVYARPDGCLKFMGVTTQYGLRVNPFLAFWWRAGAMDCSAGSWGPFRPPYKEALDQVNTPPYQSIDILTDQDNAYGVWVTDVTNVNLWTQSFKEAVAWQMAVPMAGPLSANQNAKKNAEKMAEVVLTQAVMVDMNQSQQDPYPDSPAITARN